MTREELIVWVRESRAKQGLPEKIEDPVVLARCAVAFAMRDVA